MRHCANSGALINYPDTYLDMVRPGIALYGHYPEEGRTGAVSYTHLDVYKRQV